MTTYVVDGGLTPAVLSVAAAVRSNTLMLNTQLSTLNANLAALNTTMIGNFSPVGAGLPGTSVNQLANISVNIAEIMKILNSTQSNQEKMTAAIDSLNRPMADISAQMTQATTIERLKLADQVENNEFQQQATNAALERSGLPPVEVKSDGFIEKTKKSIKNALAMSSEIKVSSMISDALEDAYQNSIAVGLKWLADTTVGQWVVERWLKLKAWYLKAEAARIARAADLEAKSIKTQVDALRPPTPTPTDQP